MNKCLVTVMLLTTVFFASGVRASSIAVTQNLNFGRMVALGSSGSITMQTSGSPANANNIQTLTNGYNGLFDYHATGLAALVSLLMNISTTTSSVTLTSNTQGAPTITVNNFLFNPDSAVVTLLSPDITGIRVGGTLNFSSRPVGQYTGTVQVRVRAIDLSQSTTANMTINAYFLVPISAISTSTLHFGRIDMVGSGSGTVRISPSGVRSIVSGSGLHLNPSSPTPTAGGFRVTGEPNQSFSITKPGTITLSSGSNTMTASNITLSSSSPAALDSSGSFDFTVGGDLVIPPGQAHGTYNGTYTITVNY